MENVPIGAEDDIKAPWNEHTEIITVPVTVSITLSKQFEVNIEVDQSRIKEDKSVDISDLELKNAVNQQVILPDVAYLHLQDPRVINSYAKYSELKQDLAGWVRDDFEVIEE